MVDKKQFFANLALFVAAFIWGVAFVAQSVAMRYVGAMTFGAARFAIGAVSLLPIMLYYRNNPEAGSDADKVTLKKTIPAGALIGVVLFIAVTLQQFGIKGTTAGKAGFITDLYIIFVPIAEVFLGKKQRKVIWACAALSAVGLYLISVTDRFTVSSGDLLVLLSSFFWTMQIMLTDKFAKQYNVIRLSFIEYIVTSALSFIAAFFFEDVSISGLWQAAFPIIFTGVFSVGVAFTCQSIGQRYAKASHASIIFSLESVVACAAGVIILHETMSLRSIIGCALMVTSMILIQLGSDSKNSSVPCEKQVPRGGAAQED